MKNKIFKTSVILVIILTMTMTNFIFVGSSFISYALDNNQNTNHNNIEFNTYFKDEKGEKVSSLEIVPSNQETILYLYLNVKQEGYMNGTIRLEDETNFKLVESDNQYVEKIEDNTIHLYNITAGSPIEIPVKIEPIQEETYPIGLLNMESKITLNGSYKDSSQKDKNIKATKTVTLKLVGEVTEEDVINEATIITNKVSNINGEEKRVVQLSWKVGTKKNHYPIQEILAQIKVPVIEGKEPQIQTQVDLNTMTGYENQYENGIHTIQLTNQETQEKTITWKTSGEENIIVTYLYDKEVQFDNILVEPEVKIKLYNEKETTHTSQIVFNEEEKDAVVEISTQNQENDIYKGKLVANIDRQYTTKTAIKVNLAKMVNEIIIQENESTYTTNQRENQANIFYVQSILAKEQFDKILGEKGVITIINQDNQEIGTIDATTPVNEKGDIVINYDENSTKGISIQTTAPVAEGILEINHTKNIKETQSQVVKEASRIHQVISCQYNQVGVNQIENNIPLQDTVTESKIEVDTDQLSTVVTNHMNMKITLLSNEEKYDLYQNPQFIVTLPEQIEGIQITNISKLYDDNHEFGDTIQYAINGNQIHFVLKGKQTNYTSTVEGITIVVEAEIQVNKKAATSEEQIVLAYRNENAVSYANDAVANAPIKITAPKEITAINNIQQLAVETIGEEEKTEVMMEKGTSAKQLEAQMEIINSNAVNINDVKILGEFPTDDSESNMGIAITRGVQVAGVEQAKVYYSANEKATDDIADAQNGWSENLEGEEAKSYLILLDTVEAQSSVQATYQMSIPENLEYNKVATEGYSVRATNSETGTGIQLDSTKIAMQTGAGPKIESQIQAMVGTDTLKENDVVKNGEVITYQIKVSNTGTEDATNIKVIEKIPEGTSWVEPMAYYEYTGSAYYQEKKDIKTYTTTIESLKAGESTTIQYMVRVNQEVKAGTSILNEIEVQYGEAKTTSTMKNVTEEAQVRVSVKRITDRSQEIYEGDHLSYYVIVENMSDAEQKDVTIQTNLSDNAEVSELTLITGMKVTEFKEEDIRDTDDENTEIVLNPNTGDEDDEDEIKKEELSYQKELNIGNLSGGETKVLCYTVETKSTGDLMMSVIAKANRQTSRSNVWGYTILKYDIKANMTTNTENQFVDIGDEIEYHITLENTGIGDANAIRIVDNIPFDLELQSIMVDGEEREVPEELNEIDFYTTVKAKSTSDIIIKTIVDYHEDTEEKTIKNVATIQDDEDVIATTQEITHIVKGVEEQGEEDPEEEDNFNNNHNNNDIGGANQGTQTTEQKGNMIAGVAWLDVDSDGVKEAGETFLSGIKVKLLNVETNEIVKDANGNEISATTDASGVYLLKNITRGKYIVIFEYDTTKYGLTTYQVSGASESQNSNAVRNELTINGVTTNVASSDIITVADKDISNINIGLIQLKNFDLKLEKYISQILIQNASGTTVKKYNNVDMAKVELDAKKIKGSTVLIEYNIKVSNVGEVDGYAKKVVDYMPSDLKFSSELNKNWYQTNGLLYCTSLANNKIAAGESKTITLTLTKSMTENNTGLTTNVAEIAEDYNELGLKDCNSTPGNKAEGENDMSRAEAIISIRTGGIVYLSIVMVMIAIGMGVTFVMIKRKKQNEKDKIIEERG